MADTEKTEVQKKTKVQENTKACVTGTECLDFYSCLRNDCVSCVSREAKSLNCSVQNCPRSLDCPKMALLQHIVTFHGAQKCFEFMVDYMISEHNFDINAQFEINNQLDDPTRHIGHVPNTSTRLKLTPFEICFWGAYINSRLSCFFVSKRVMESKFVTKQREETIARLSFILSRGATTELHCGCSLFELVENIEDPNWRVATMDALGGGCVTKACRRQE